MNEVIVILMLVCGQPDTILIKAPDQQATYTHDVFNEIVVKNLADILEKKPTVIVYEDKRGICA